MNGLYESLVIIVVFPLIVSIGAGGSIKGKNSAKICKFLGDISYPLYITHYPLIYLFTAWVVNNKVPLGGYGLFVGLMVFITSIAIAYACLKLYDEPVREWLKKRYLTKKAG
jgi:peptidoglycan/LPS O-acetylase OafA/YrhL